MPRGPLVIEDKFCIYVCIKFAGQVHTHLSQYNHCMRNSDEYIAGPVAEFYIAEGGNFEKHVEIRIPHCLRKGRKDAVRVLQGSENNYEVTETTFILKG